MQSPWTPLGYGDVSGPRYRHHRQTETLSLQRRRRHQQEACSASSLQDAPHRHRRLSQAPSGAYSEAPFFRKSHYLLPSSAFPVTTKIVSPVLGLRCTKRPADDMTIPQTDSCHGHRHGLLRATDLTEALEHGRMQLHHLTLERARRDPLTASGSAYWSPPNCVGGSRSRHSRYSDPVAGMPAQSHFETRRPDWAGATGGHSFAA